MKTWLLILKRSFGYAQLGATSSLRVKWIMSKRRQPGQNIRKLALKRRLKAVYYFIAAGGIIMIPFAVTHSFADLLKPISSLNPSQPKPSFNFPPIYYILFVIISLGLITNGVFLWKRANHADQGAKGEEDAGREMLQLEQEGWQVEYGMLLGGGLGDADIVCISPQNKAYAIDIKSHRGEVTTDGNQLYKQMGRTTYPFEKDFLDRCMKQALQVKQQKNLSFVTPILAFSDAKVSVPADKLRKVYVVEKLKLVSLLKSLG
jgi:Nuclease-related domain